MKLLNPPHSGPMLPHNRPATPPPASHKPVAAQETPPDLNAPSSTGYPMMSERERMERGLGSLKNKFRPKNPTPPKRPGATKKPDTPPKIGINKPPAPSRPRTPATATQELGGLQQRGLLPPLQPSLGTVVRNAIVSASVEGLVSLPFSVGQHADSSSVAARIKAQAHMPGAQKKNLDGTSSTLDPAATQEQVIAARLEAVEIKVEMLVNSIVSINEGPEAKALGKGPNAPTATNERLASLENVLDIAESQMKVIAKEYKLVYEPYVAPASSEAATEMSRLDVIEKRQTEMSKMIKALIAVKQTLAEDDN